MNYSEYYKAWTAPKLESYEAAQLPTYEAQTDKVNETYAAKQEADIAALQSAYDTSLLEANANLAKIPGTYTKAANTVAAQAEKNRQQFNEYAASRGVSSGAGSQAQLAMNNQMQSDLSDIRLAQANAVANAQLEITKIKTAYQDNVAAAVKQNDYEKAAALLAEYQMQAQSIVSVAQAQADENYRAWQSQIANEQYIAEWNRARANALYTPSYGRARYSGGYSGGYSGSGSSASSSGDDDFYVPTLGVDMSPKQSDDTKTKISKSIVTGTKPSLIVGRK